MRLEQLTQEAYDRYNTDGPASRVYTAVGGHPVPRWPENRDHVVLHKWRAATSHAAIGGAEAMIALVAAGETDPEKLRAAALSAFGCGPWDDFANTTGPNPHAQGRGPAICYTSNVA
jgi:hypothetical protein